MLTVHPEILDGKRIRLLQSLVRLPELSPFDMAGGTALSLQLGLRVSHDFDFFSPDDFNREHLLSTLRSTYPSVETLQLVHGTCDVLIDGIQVSFFHYPYPRIAPPLTDFNGFPGLKLSSLDDIAAMKLSAIGSRASRKDFYDLYQILHVGGLSPTHLLDDVHRKFGETFDATYMLMSLSYFADAESEVLPKCFVKTEWDEIKSYFIGLQPTLMELERKRFLPY